MRQFLRQCMTSVTDSRLKRAPLQDPLKFPSINHNPASCKLFEKLVRCPLYYLLSQNLIINVHRGYLKCWYMLSVSRISLTNLQKLSTKEGVSLSSLRTTKSFHRFPQLGIFIKFPAQGLDISLLEWFFHLSKRQRVVHIKEMATQPIPVNKWVIQGVCLSRPYSWCTSMMHST